MRKLIPTALFLCLAATGAAKAEEGKTTPPAQPKAGGNVANNVNMPANNVPGRIVRIVSGEPAAHTLARIVPADPTVSIRLAAPPPERIWLPTRCADGCAWEPPSRPG